MIDWVTAAAAEATSCRMGCVTCGNPVVLGLHVVSDALITLAYFSIPFTLVYFSVRGRSAVVP